MGRWGLALGAGGAQTSSCRRGEDSPRQGALTAGRRMRVDTTVVETDIHHPTDSGLYWGTGFGC